MFSLAFYPEHDAHHAAFRALCIRTRISALPISAYRIVDYFFLNPYDLGSFRMPGSTQRKIAAKFEYLRPYKRNTEPAAAALHMWQFQQAALTVLARRNFIVPAALSDERVQFTDESLSGDLRAKVESDALLKKDVMDFLIDAMTRFPLGGSGGLKDRSGLLDFRYDVKSDAVAA